MTFQSWKNFAWSDFCRRAFSRFGIVIFLFVVFAFCSIFFTNCRRIQQTDLRKLAPNDALIYLETNDVAEALTALTDNQAFQKLVQNTPDFSNFRNVQTAIVVTSFGTSEEAISENESVLNFKPQFVVIAETHLWSWQAISLVENQINHFVYEKLGQNTRLEKSEKYGGKFFAWTAMDNRRIFAFVEDGLIYFGNNETAIEKCLTVKKGDAESLAANELLSENYSAKNLAFGYVSPAGVSEIANLAGVFTAVQKTEEIDGRNFIARIVPQILRNTTKEIVWTANKSSLGIEDKFMICLDPKLSAVKENFVAADENKTNLTHYLPPEIFGATRYNLKTPLAAWQNLILLTANSTDALSGKLIVRFSASMLEPYNISDAEKFLNSIDSEIITAQFDENNEESVVIAKVKNAEILKKSVSKEISFNLPAKNFENAEVWFSADKTSAAAIVENILILGDAESVLKCLQAGRNEQSSIKNQRFEKFVADRSLAATFSKDADSAEKIAGILAGKKSENMKLAIFYLTETNLTEKGFERATVSDFGLLGTILKQLER